MRAAYPDNFKIEDIIDTSYYEKKQTKVKLKKYKTIEVVEYSKGGKLK